MSAGFAVPLKNARPAASPKPAGMITATVVVPFFTAARASSDAGVDTDTHVSRRAPSTIPADIAE
ncbi:MAG: hypothetical protein QM736_23830 [Vicinamibacterales bacterium]